MSGITDPAQEYFKNGLWAWVTDQWKKLIGDAAGHLQVDVVASGLPTGAATSANQTTMITALQLIDDLRAALNSIGTDELDVVIDGQSADVEVTQQTAADLTPGVMGWDGSAWRKLPLLWGYSGRVAEWMGGTQSGDGAYTAYSTVVPSGEVHVTTGVFIRNNGGARGLARIGIVSGGNNYWMAAVIPSAQYIPLLLTGSFVLAAGDKLIVSMLSCLDGDVVEAGGVGYKMKVAE